jgi:hypothetical protein
MTIAALIGTAAIFLLIGWTEWTTGWAPSASPP